MRKYAKFFVTPKGERAARGGHPWVFGEEVTKIEGEYANGDLVDVVTSKGKYLGTGFVNDHSCALFPPILMISLTKPFGSAACAMRWITA